jgi:hypothetical protein
MPTRPGPTVDELRARLASLRELLVSSVTLPTDRLQDAVDDAVRRGRMTRRDAEELVSTLVSAGRAQTEAMLADLERLVGLPGRAAANASPAGGGGGARGGGAGGAGKRGGATGGGRRAGGAGGGGRFPIAGYDDLTAAEISKRLKDLTPAQLRRVRDHERQGANRKSVLAAVDRRLK